MRRTTRRRSVVRASKKREEEEDVEEEEEEEAASDGRQAAAARGGEPSIWEGGGSVRWYRGGVYMVWMDKTDKRQDRARERRRQDSIC